MRLRLFILLTLLFLIVTGRERPWADANVVFQTTASLVDRHRLDLPPLGGSPWFYAQHDGRRYGVFPLGSVVAMAPSYLLLKALRHIPGLPDDALLAFACHLTPALLMAGACTIFFVLALRLGASRRWALLLTLLLAATTICFVYARSLYSEALQTIALLWLAERTLRQGERATQLGMAGLGIAAGILLNTKLVHAALLPIPAVYLFVCHRRELGRFLRFVPAALLAFAPFIALALWHNHVKTGSYWSTGYDLKTQFIHRSMFSGDLLTGLFGLLLSPGKGVLFYSPPLVLSLFAWPTFWRRQRRAAALVLAFFAVALLVNGKFEGWHGDYSWGPRHLVPLTPLLLLAAAPWIEEAMARGRRWLRRTALASLAAAGLAVQLLGAAFYWDHFIRVLIAVKDQTGARGWFEWSLSHGHFFPVFSPIRGHLWLLGHYLSGDPNLPRDAPWALAFPGKLNLGDAWARLRLDWWWLNWQATWRASLVADALFAIMIAGLGWTLISLLRRQR